MKILHVISGLDDGGAEAVLYRLVQFDSTPCIHTVVSLADGGKYASLLQELGVKVVCLDMKNSRFKFYALFKLYRFIRILKPNAIQTWMFHGDLIGGIVGRLAGVRNITWGVHHTTLVKGESKRSTILIAKINAFISKFVPRNIIYCAEKSREVQESIGFKKSIGHVVSNGYRVDDYSPNTGIGSQFRNEINVDPQTFLIGHVGRYDPQKDQKNLLDALGMLKAKGLDFNAVIVGTNLDNNNQTLLDLVDLNDLINNVQLLGRRNDIPAVMNGIDLFVLSSAFGEAFPNVLNEAMACGTPCVTTNVGDSSVIVGNTGWIVGPRNAKQLADAIENAYFERLNDSEKWQDRKQKARERIVENFSIDKMVANYHSVWRGL
ncbi:glycosyl transferase [Thiosulfatimonas sediminis]|uniref:Glycosyl transferase n=1 Tax=Thiosulfatimonas sediminis TaxID=2675054 RepID=A0A6F8PT13_9GAMM|nr:glycosyltransferase [Thiosulfatimonas sediminis]BBP45273.1 glycosyl transferase [Thiosulfatimonas sediminis]